MPSRKTPEERSAVLEAAQQKAKRSYRTNTKRDRKGLTNDEREIITDMLVSLKLVGGYSNSQCAAIVGLSRGQVKAIVTDAKFIARLSAVKAKLPEAALNLGRAFLVEGVMAVVHVLRTEKDNALVLKAAAELFDRFGIPKMSRTEITDPGPNPDGDEMSNSFYGKLKSAPPEVQEKAAALHESFLEGVNAILAEGNNGDSD